MKNYLLSILLFGTALANANADADVFKCMVNGKTRFSDTPCKDGGGKVEIKNVVTSNTSAMSGDLKKKDEESNTRLKKKSLSEDIDRNLERIRQLNKERNAELSVLQERIAGNSQNLRQAMDKSTAASQMQAVNSNYDNQIKELERENDRLRLERDSVGKKID